MIWKTEHINDQAKNVQLEIEPLLHRNTNLKPDSDSDFTVGIVGAGPKGMYALEELLRQFSNHSLKNNLTIYWFNESPYFGSGPNYQPNQPDYLLINYCIGHIDAWDKNSQKNAKQLNFLQWIEQYKIVNNIVSPTDYASRALVGLYLQHVLLNILHQKHQNISLHLVDQKVINVKTNLDQKIHINTNNIHVAVDNLLLATGHCYKNSPLINLKDESISNNYFISAYPIEKFNTIKPNQKVGIIGWGLTFIDVALALTEGRGGKFDSEDKYLPSGNEPILYPFSRNQLPIMPRGPIYGDTVYSLKYINQKWLQAIKNESKSRKIDFCTEILPLLEKELRFAYYSTFLQTTNEVVIEKYIESLDEKNVFSFNDLLFPTIRVSQNLQQSYIQHLDYLIAEAEKGELKSPLMAAAAVWREASSFIAEIYQFGGFTGESQKYLDQQLFSAFCRTSYGPPIENMKKIRALIEAEIIKIRWNNSIKIDEYKEKFTLGNNDNLEVVDYIIDARIARPDIDQSNSELYDNLYQNNNVQPYTNDNYTPGCLALDDFAKIKDQYNSPIYFYGSNTEGLLLDNDSLSRRKNNLAPKWAKELICQIISTNLKSK